MERGWKQQLSHSPKLLLKWIGSYFWVLAVPLLFGIILHAHSLKTLQRESWELLSKDVERDFLMMNTMLDSMDQICISLLGQEDIRSFHEEHTNPFYALQLKNIQDVLKQMVSSNTVIKSSYIYYPQAGSFIGNDGSLSVQDKDTMYKYRFSLKRDTLFDYLSSLPYNGLYLLEEEGISSLFYFYASRDLTDPSVTVILQLKEQTIQRQFVTEGISILMIDPLKNTLLLGEKLEASAIALLEAMKEGQKTAQNRSYSIHARYQEGYQLYAIMKTGEYRKNLEKSRFLLLFYVLLCLLVGSCLVIWLAKRQYSPVRDLLLLTEQGQRETSALEESEYERLQHSIRAILGSYEENKRLLQNQRLQLQSSYLASLLCSRHTSYETDAGYYQKLQEHFTAQQFVLFSFDIADVAKVEETEEKEGIFGQTEGPVQQGEVLYLLLCQVIEHFLSKEYALISTCLGDYFYFLAGVSEPEPFVSLEQTIRQICLFLQETYQMTVWGNLSEYHQKMEGLFSAYRELNMLTDYRNRIGSDQVTLCYHQVKTQPEVLAQLQLWELERQVICYMEKHQYAPVAPLLSALLQSERTEEPLEASENRGQGSIKEEREETSEQERRLQEIEEYIDKHYQEKQLTVSEIAERFQFNTSYLSRIFKERKEIGILAYINQKRLEQAKELLAEGWTVTDTASEVGFYTTRPLLRLFHDLEGMTPTEYQRQRRKRTDVP